MSENELKALDNFPLLERLTTVLASRNKISSIADNLADQLPNLESLVLNDNDLASLDALEPLRTLPRLTRLSVQNNPVMHESDARLALIHRLPQLRLLNFNRVRQAERAAATAKFGKAPPVKKRKRAAVANEATAKSNGATSASKRAKLSVAQQEELAKKIAAACSVEEVQRLEAALREGVMPT